MRGFLCLQIDLISWKNHQILYHISYPTLGNTTDDIKHDRRY